MTNTRKPIISRRSRPAKAPLSKEIIIETALDLIKKEGMDGLSLRKVAAALDTGPASLYVYVANLNELNAFVLDLGLGGVDLPRGSDGNENWKKRLLDLLESYQTVLQHSPGLAELAQTTIPIGPNSLNIMEAIIGLLEEGGVHSLQAAWGADLLFLYVTSASYEQSSRIKQGITTEPIAAVFQTLDSERYPKLTGVKDELLQGDAQRFRWGLEVMIGGILQHSGAPPEPH